MRKSIAAVAASLVWLGLGAGCAGDAPADGSASVSDPAAATSIAEAGTAAATEAASPDALAETATAPAASVDQASRAFIDPVTGEMRTPTAAEIAALQPSPSNTPALKQRPDAPVETRLPDGTIRYDMRNQPPARERVCVLADGGIGACPEAQQAAE